MVKNLKDLMAKFQNENACREFLIQQRWNGSPECPYCGHTKVYNIEGGKRFKCANSACYKKFSVTVGTVFEASNIPLNIWFPAMYLIASHKKGISSIQLAKDLGVTQKTGWFMLHRIRESLKAKDSILLTGTVEMDETFVGGNIKNKHAKERKRLSDQGRGYTHKKPVFGMLQREGDVILKTVDKADGETLKPIIRQTVCGSSMVLTDGFGGYKDLHLEFAGHEVLNHAAGEYVRQGFHTNTIEGFFAFLKRSLYGIYHCVSPKHLQRYCDENAYRYNTRKMKDGERFTSTLSKINGRLSYKMLVHGKANQEINAQNTQETGE